MYHLTVMLMLILETYRNSFLFTDLASDVDTGPNVDGFKEVGQGTDTATVSHSLSILTDDVAWAEIDNYT